MYSLEFMKMGLRGISVLFASGDQGIGSGTYMTPSATAEEVAIGCSQAWPNWPASSPYVTTVGATTLTDKFLPACGEQYANTVAQTNNLGDAHTLLFECTGTAETTCNALNGGRITSGGGFSDVYERSSTAPWQQAAVDTYLSYGTAYSPPTSYFSPQGRAYPDLAAYGSNYFVYLGGAVQRESGTSASTPTVAAMVQIDIVA